MTHRFYWDRLCDWFWGLPEPVVGALFLTGTLAAIFAIGLSLCALIDRSNTHQGHFRVLTPQGSWGAVKIQYHTDYLLYWTESGQEGRVQGGFAVETGRVVE
jgi:hypothetical protein